MGHRIRINQPHHVEDERQIYFFRCNERKMSILMKKISRETKKKIVHHGSIALLVALFVALALVGVKIWDESRNVYNNPTPPTPSNEDETGISYDGKDYVRRDGIETVLVVGLDSVEMDEEDTSYYNTQQSDFLMLLVLDNEKRECAAVQINRDTMTPVNILGVAGQKIGTEEMQIALSHTYGNGKLVSLRNTSDAVSTLLLDMKKIDCGVTVAMDAVGILNDRVGGVEVEILEDFSGIDDTLVKGEVMKLSGEQALTYVRSRGGVADGTNVNRMNRQRQYLNALFTAVKAKAAEDDMFVANSALELSDYFVSNATTDTLTTLFEKVTDYTFTGIRTLEGTSKEGEKYMEFYPDGTKLTGLVVELFCKEK